MNNIKQEDHTIKKIPTHPHLLNTCDILLSDTEPCILKLKKEQSYSK